jgi:hypothetical protein
MHQGRLSDINWLITTCWLYLVGLLTKIFLFFIFLLPVFLFVLGLITYPDDKPGHPGRILDF